MFNRRQFFAGAAVTPLAFSAVAATAQTATPAATPLASPVPESDDVVSAWQDAQAELAEHGQAAAEAFWQADVDTLADVGSPDVVAALGSADDLRTVIEGFTLDQIHFSFREVGAWLFGRYTPESIAGMFIYGGPSMYWEATPDETQTGDIPSGAWSGTIDPGGLDLGIELVFAGDADTLAVNLSIPSQAIVDAPSEDVLFWRELPVGDRVDERSIPAGGDVTWINNYAEQYEWGSHTLVLNQWWFGDGQLAGINLIPQVTLPEIPDRDTINARLPFDGAWVVVWGCETEFRNYHAVVPTQRYASDILLWQDGSTAIAPGTENEHYHAFGQPYIAPVSGTVVTMQDGLEDIAPQGTPNPDDHPAGNHIVIEVDEGFVFLAHCRQGSIMVEEGDSVEAGDVVAAVGNSGNTSEPHVHIHAQSTADYSDFAAAGIPIVFENVVINNEPTPDVMLQHGTIAEQRA